MPRPFIVAAVALAIVALAPGVTLAQVGTPTPDFVSPDSAECQIAPRSIDSIASALATPSPEPPRWSHRKATDRRANWQMPRPSRP